MSNHADRLWEPCPLCNARADFPLELIVCGKCDGRRFVPTDVSRLDVEEAVRLLADVADAADDAAELSERLKSMLPDRRRATYGGRR